MDDKKYRISQLILKDLTGQLAEEEQKELNTWIKENKENQLIFRQIQSGKTFDSKYEIYKKTNWQIPFRKFEKTINRSKFLRKRILRYAAILLLPFTVGIYFLCSPEPVPVTALKPALVPGCSKAVLILSNGKEIPLNSSALTSAVLPSNIQLNPRKNQLTYQSKQLATSSNNILRTPKGGEYQLKLSDGTLVHLNSASELIYPEVFPSDKREVYISGEAWFEVAKDAKRPFYVKTEELQIRVIGTKFNINTQVPHKVQTALAEGCIRITTPKDNKETILYPNQLAEYDKNNHSLYVKETDILPYISWKDGLFVFSGEKLENIMERLSFWYDFQTFFNDEKLKSIRFTGYLKRYDDISIILKAIENTISVKFEIKGQMIIVSG